MGVSAALLSPDRVWSVVMETRQHQAGHATGEGFDREPIEKAMRRVYALVHARTNASAQNGSVHGKPQSNQTNEDGVGLGMKLAGTLATGPPKKVRKISTNKKTAMKKTWMCCLIGFFLLVSAAWSQTGSIEKAIAALEQQWLQGQKTNNPDPVAPLLADKFVNTGSDGKVTNKAETLETVKTTKYESAEYEDMKVTVFGNTAIATGGFKATGTDASGRPFNIHERWTDTWVKISNGQWQCVASHGSPINM